MRTTAELSTSLGTVKASAFFEPNNVDGVENLSRVESDPGLQAGICATTQLDLYKAGAVLGDLADLRLDALDRPTGFP